MTAFLYAAIFGILRATDGAGRDAFGKGKGGVSRGVIMAIGGALLTLHYVPSWWMYDWYYFCPVQTLALWSIAFGGLSSLLDWAQGLKLSQPKEHTLSYWVWGWIKEPWVWPVTRLCAGITPVCVINGVWWAIPVGALMAYCYRWSYLYKDDVQWVTRAEFASYPTGYGDGLKSLGCGL